jgi:hypothetical protein
MEAARRRSRFAAGLGEPVDESLTDLVALAEVFDSTGRLS